MTDLLWYGLNAVVLALVTLLGYELHAWLTRDEPTISWIVRRWRGTTLWRKILIMVVTTIIAWSIQFLGIHFAFNVG